MKNQKDYHELVEYVVDRFGTIYLDDLDIDYRIQLARAYLSEHDFDIDEFNEILTDKSSDILGCLLAEEQYPTGNLWYPILCWLKRSIEEDMFKANLPCDHQDDH